MKTRAVRDGNGYVLNGTKRYITNAPFADVILVMARTNAEALPKNAHVSAFMVPRDALGVSIGKPDGKMGQAGSQIADVILEDVHVDGDALLGGEEGIGFRAAIKASITGGCPSRRRASAMRSGCSTPASNMRWSARRSASRSPISS